ncbi:hypothetical protein [Streptomyces sp. UNOC14_S4]|uniref:hypothetical protein n=1 Tax=Streptomyces sp. UNOC14_S4 TaxID=2872340 RepID=UPI001E3E4412|nr:hypothetical protein [Streptomyces sp. UNOC14_S4]MCC3770436.1 hypothetical protein [Streptomyces sp. UNOC14_S4]
MSTATGVSSRLTVGQVDAKCLSSLRSEAAGIGKKAMELTDSWGQAMFILDRETVERLFRVIGFSADVVSGVYDGVRDIAYVEHKVSGEPARAEFTYHALDATCLVLRGVTDLGSALGEVGDGTAEKLITEERALFDRIMGSLPDYCRHLMFSPEVAARVIASLGGHVSADKLYELAGKFGGRSTRDLEGRRGVSTQFIRAFTLTLSATV